MTVCLPDEDRSFTDENAIFLNHFKFFFPVFILALFCTPLQGQQESADQQQLPRVFLIGQYSDQYARISGEYPANLLSVYQNDMELAYEKWAGMLVEMENYAEEIDYDINGTKFWFHIYFNADGTIAYLTFYPKPNSRNIPVEELVAFFKSFCKVYKIPVTAEIGFQQSASASFPTFFGDTRKATAKKE